jgi:hypothetical protein
VHRRVICEKKTGLEPTIILYLLKLRTEWEKYIKVFRLLYSEINSISKKTETRHRTERKTNDLQTRTGNSLRRVNTKFEENT